jgi:chromosomal replication initiation ATPase DnaA
MIKQLIMNERFIQVAIIGDKKLIQEIKEKIQEVEGEVVYFDKNEEFKPKVREFDIFIVDEILDEDEEKFFKKIYRSIENSGYMILTPKFYNENRKQFLEDIGFVAVNETDKYITAKKMHGWGSL